MGRRLIDPAVRFWWYVQKAEDCWLWTGGKGRGGYGKFSPSHRVTQSAHRYSYELHVGPIPDGLQLDHVCRVRACVNPAHLRPVTIRENLLAPGAVTHAKINADKTHCPAGHEYNAENTTITAGRRRCRPCQARNTRACREKKMSAYSPLPGPQPAPPVATYTPHHSLPAQPEGTP